MSIINRIIQVVDSEQPKAIFTKKTGISSSNIANWRNNPNKNVNSDILEAILAGYPEISAEWLLRGVGLQFSKDIYNNKNIVTKVNESEIENEKEDKLKCVLTGADCSFREMDMLRKENDSLRREVERLKR